MLRLFSMRLQKLLGILQYWTGKFYKLPRKAPTMFFQLFSKMAVLHPTILLENDSATVAFLEAFQSPTDLLFFRTRVDYCF